MNCCYGNRTIYLSETWIIAMLTECFFYFLKTKWIVAMISTRTMCLAIF